jgi:hypothetical protein
MYRKNEVMFEEWLGIIQRKTMEIKIALHVIISVSIKWCKAVRTFKCNFLSVFQKFVTTNLLPFYQLVANSVKRSFPF